MAYLPGGWGPKERGDDQRQQFSRLKLNRPHSLCSFVFYNDVTFLKKDSIDLGGSNPKAETCMFLCNMLP